MLIVPLLYAAGAVSISWVEVWFGKPGQGWVLWRLVPPVLFGGLITLCIVVNGYASEELGLKKSGAHSRALRCSLRGC